MKYRVEYTTYAVRRLKKLDKVILSFIISYIDTKLVGCENPRLYGKALRGSLNDKWRYRVGDYRILAKIDDGLVTITVVEVGHRSDIYD